MADEGSKLWYLEKLSLLEEMPLDLLKSMDTSSTLHKTYKREPIYVQNSASDTIFFCKKGRVKISRTSEDGKETTLYIVQPGEIFGELALVDSGRRTHRAEALDDEVIVCSFSKKRFEDILGTNAELSRKVYMRIGDRMRTIEQKLADLVFKGSEERIIKFLLDVGADKLRKSIDEAYIRPFFTHEEIAHLTATSRQTVTTTLNDLKKEGLITFSRNKMYIKQYSQLQKRLDSYHS